MIRKMQAVHKAIYAELDERRLGPIKPSLVMGKQLKFNHTTLSGFLDNVRVRLLPEYKFTFGEQFITDALALDVLMLTAKVDENTK